MEFRIADTFVDSLGKLTPQEQKAVKTTVFDLQINPANPGMSLHKLDRAQGPQLCLRPRQPRCPPDRASQPRQPADLLCRSPRPCLSMGAAPQAGNPPHHRGGATREIRETVQEIVIPTYVTEEKAKPLLFTGRTDDELLGYGVPPEWLDDVRSANEDTILELADHLPAEAAEALLELATGGIPQVPPISVPVADPFEHPDALRRFRVMGDVDELARALEYPWEKWAVFLHPEQRRFATGDYNGPARVSGSAGTGKTVVALHRAVHLAKNNPDSRVLLATFSEYARQCTQDQPAPSDL